MMNCVFIGYVQNSSPYRFLVYKSKNSNMYENTIVESRNVYFFENVFPYKGIRKINSLKKSHEKIVRRSKRAKVMRFFSLDFIIFLMKSELQCFEEAIFFSEEKSG